MTISTTTARVRLAADGTSTDFAFPYFFEQEEHLFVFLSDTDGSEVQQMLEHRANMLNPIFGIPIGFDL